MSKSGVGPDLHNSAFGGRLSAPRSADTEAVYERRVRRFVAHVKARSMAVDWRGLLLAYEALMRERKPSTRRQNRAALRFWIAKFLSEEQERLFSEQAAVIDREWRKKRKGGKGGKGTRQAGGLLRHMPEEVRRPIALHLYGLGSVYGMIVADILIATPVVGLRPKEWALSTLEGDLLRVENSKYQPGIRANGQFRTLILDRDAIKGDEMEAITRLVFAMQGRQWNALRQNLQPVLKEAISRLVAAGTIAARWKRLRFYDGRHQFSAEAKASLDALAGEVAAVMGHASATTAVHHYGRRKKAQRKSAVRPAPESVEAVKTKTLERLAALAAKRRPTVAPDPPVPGPEPKAIP